MVFPRFRYTSQEPSTTTESIPVCPTDKVAILGQQCYEYDGVFIRCTSDHSSCVPNVDGSWTCQCIKGYYIDTGTGVCVKEQAAIVTTIQPTLECPKDKVAGLGQQCYANDGVFVICSSENSACVPSNGGSWTCQCISGYVDVGAGVCLKEPKQFFPEVQYRFRVLLTDPANTTVGRIALHDDVISLLNGGGAPEVTVTLGTDHLKGSIDGTNAVISTTRPITEFLSTVLTLEIKSSHITLRDSVYITIGPMRTLQVLSLVIIDGTTAKSVVGDLMSFGIDPYMLAEYEISFGGSASNILNLDANTGVISTKVDVDIDSVTSSDTFATWFTTGQVIFLRQKDRAADLQPVTVNVLIYKRYFAIDISEARPSGYVFATFNTANEWKITTDTTYFDLNANNNTLSLRNRLDYSVMKSYDVNVILSHDSLTAHVALHISVVDVDDKTPVFKESSYFINVRDATVGGTVIGYVHAMDVDTMSKISYSFVESYPSSVLSINEDGVLSTTQIVNKNTFKEILSQNNSTFHVQASDGLHTATAKVQIAILTVDNSRTFNYSFKGDFLENQPPGQYVLSVWVSGYSNYSFLHTKYSDYFQPHSTTGEVTSAQGIDREVLDTDTISLTVSAYFGSKDDCSFTILGEAQITVLDENDNSPRFEKVKYYGTIRENSPDGTTISVSGGVMLATDKDKDNNARITYSINSAGPFSIQGNTGIITANPLDRELMDVYSLTILAKDGTVDSPSRFTTTTVIIITVTDENDNVPIFSSDSYSANLMENTFSSSIGSVTATDRDSGINGEVNYEITGGGRGMFIINETSGVIGLSSSTLDREVNKDYSLAIMAYDMGRISQKTFAVFNITVLDDNDERPVFKAPFDISVEEHVSCDTAFAHVVTTDKDEGVNARISYELLSNHDIFSIDSSGGISCKIPLDFDEGPKDFSIQIRATDGASPFNTADKEFKIHLTDINDNAPLFKPHAPINVSFEELDMNKPVAVIQVVDKDSLSNGQVELQFLSGNVADHFKIDPTNGIVRVKNTNTISTGTYTSVIQATDEGTPPRSSTTQLTIYIFSEISATFAFTKTDFVMNVLEGNRDKSTSIGTLSVSNPNGEAIVFVLMDHYGDLFSVSSDGQVLCNAILDRESTPVYNIMARVQMVDRTDISDLAMITVNVIDVNDNSPEFIGESVLSHDENAPVGTLIGTLSAVDKDVGTNAVLEYRSSMVSPFKVDLNTGRVVVSSQLDREQTSDGKYVFPVTISDRGSPPLTATATVTIYVLDVNEHKPVFPNTQNNLQIMENKHLGAEVTTLKASDADSTDEYKVHSYTLSPTDCKLGVKTVSSASGLDAVLFLRENLDRETEDTFECTLIAKDGGATPLSGTTLISVQVLDVNDGVPRIVNAPLQINISSATAVGNVIIDSLRVEDTDTGKNAECIFYSEDSPDATNVKVLVNEKSGTVTLNGDLMDLGTDLATIIITVKDQGVPPLSSSVAISVKITDDNVRPRFPENIYSYSIYEEYVSTQTYYIKAQDFFKDGARECLCTYRIDGGSEFFTISSKSGLLEQTKPVDREANNIIEIRIIGRDGDPDFPLDSEPALIRFTIKDINDEPPKFEQIQYDILIKEDLQNGMVIGKVTAVDRDESDNAITEYNLVNEEDAAPFKIESDSGNIYSTTAMPHSTDFQRVFTIQATDTKKRTYFSRTSVVVKFSDKNQFAPQFTKAIYEINLPVTTSVGEKVILHNYPAQDADANNTAEGTIIYDLITTSYSDHFTINNQTGTIYVSKVLLYVDEDVRFINLSVRASDNGYPVKTGTCVVRVQLTGQRIQVCAALNDQLSGEIKERKMYFGLFIGLLILCVLAIAAVIVLVFRYVKVKHRLASCKTNQSVEDGSFPKAKDDKDKFTDATHYGRLQMGTREDTSVAKPYAQFTRNVEYINPVADDYDLAMTTRGGNKSTSDDYELDVTTRAGNKSTAATDLEDIHLQSGLNVSYVEPVKREESERPDYDKDNYEQPGERQQPSYPEYKEYTPRRPQK